MELTIHQRGIILRGIASGASLRGKEPKNLTVQHGHNLQFQVEPDRNQLHKLRRRGLRNGGGFRRL